MTFIWPKRFGYILIGCVYISLAACTGVIWPTTYEEAAVACASLGGLRYFEQQTAGRHTFVAAQCNNGALVKFTLKHEDK